MNNTASTSIPFRPLPPIGGTVNDALARLGRPPLTQEKPAPRRRKGEAKPVPRVPLDINTCTVGEFKDATDEFFKKSWLPRDPRHDPRKRSDS